MLYCNKRLTRHPGRYNESGTHGQEKQTERPRAYPDSDYPDMGSGYRQLGFLPKQTDNARTAKRRHLQQAGVCGFTYHGNRMLRRPLRGCGRSCPAPAKVYASGVNRAGNTDGTYRGARNVSPRLQEAFRFASARTGGVTRSICMAGSTAHPPLPKRSFLRFLFLFSPLLSALPASPNATGEPFLHFYFFPLHRPTRFHSSLTGLFPVC